MLKTHAKSVWFTLGLSHTEAEGTSEYIVIKETCSSETSFHGVLFSRDLSFSPTTASSITKLKKIKLYILKNSTALASERDRSHERETSSV